ncbi:hypothetical protein ACFYM0_06960 [Streptomyces sp. NPDC006487]|uniref:hypothetical protein n=1 Tax=Streptomyces sp. NPDC006487 TaxID=3364748 RepID=UPI0036BFA6AC
MWGLSEQPGRQIPQDRPGRAAPADDALVMRAVPTEAPGAGGGLIDTARGLGTAIGVSLVTLALHAGGDGGRLAVPILPDADRTALRAALPALTRLAARLEEAD